jgi:two-component system, LuxR family, response regulator FixJ
MDGAEPIVHVVDDDEAMCEALQWLLESAGLRAETYTSAEAFLDAYQPAQPGCLVVDVRMRGMSGLDLQRRLVEQKIGIPVIIITGHGDVPMAVRAVKAGAVDFLEKPVNDELLVERIRSALELDARRREDVGQRNLAAARLARLTPREREVIDLLVACKINKQIAAELGMSEKTVEVHRRHIMRKLQVKSAAELVRAALLWGIPPPP